MDKKSLRQFVKLVEKERTNRYQCKFNPTLEELDYLNTKGVYAYPNGKRKFQGDWNGITSTWYSDSNLFFAE